MGSAYESLALPVASSELGSWMLKFPQACIELPAGQPKGVAVAVADDAAVAVADAAAVLLSRLQD